MFLKVTLMTWAPPILFIGVGAFLLGPRGRRSGGSKAEVGAELSNICKPISSCGQVSKVKPTWIGRPFSGSRDVESENHTLFVCEPHHHQEFLLQRHLPKRPYSRGNANASHGEATNSRTPATAKCRGVTAAKMWGWLD